MAGSREESFSPAASWNTEDSGDDDMDFEVRFADIDDGWNRPVVGMVVLRSEC